MQLENKVTLVTPPDFYYGNSNSVCVAGINEQDLTTLVLLLSGTDTGNWTIYSYNKDDPSWLYQCVRQSMFVLAYTDNLDDDFHKGWLLAQPNVHYTCNYIEQYAIINTRWFESVTEVVDEYL